MSFMNILGKVGNREDGSWTFLKGKVSDQNNFTVTWIKFNCKGEHFFTFHLYLDLEYINTPNYLCFLLAQYYK